MSWAIETKEPINHETNFLCDEVAINSIEVKLINGGEHWATIPLHNFLGAVKVRDGLPAT